MQFNFIIFLICLFLTSQLAYSQILGTYSTCKGANTKVSNIVSVDGNHFAVYYEADYKDYIDFFSIENGELRLNKSSYVPDLTNWDFGNDGVWEVYGDVLNTKMELSSNNTYLFYLDGSIECDIITESPEVIEIDLVGNVLGVLTFEEADELIGTNISGNYELGITTSSDLFAYQVLQDDSSLFNFESSLLFNGLEHLDDYLLLYGVEDNNAFFQVFDFEGNTNNSTEDIEIISVNIEPIKYWFSMGVYKYRFPETFVEVRNNGSEVINELQLKLDLANCSNFMCVTNYIFTNVENANLLPNETKVFNIREVEVQFYSPSLNCADYTEHCISIANPNKAIDTNVDNNYLCIVSDVIASANQPILNEQLNIHPNLFNNQLTIETETETQIDIWSISGKQVYSTNIIGKQFINTQTWASGVYIMQFKNKSGFVTNKKIIKN